MSSPTKQLCTYRSPDPISTLTCHQLSFFELGEEWVRSALDIGFHLNFLNTNKSRQIDTKLIHILYK